MNADRPVMTDWTDPRAALDLLHLAIQGLDSHSGTHVLKEAMFDSFELALAAVDEDEDVQALRTMQLLSGLAAVLVSEVAARHRPTAKLIEDYVSAEQAAA